MLEQVKDTFWDHWSKEYLPELIYYAQSRNTNVKDIEIGDVVLIESNKDRGKWKLGKIEKLLIGKDGKIRAAEVKTEKKTLIKRAIQKLYPLEISSTERSGVVPNRDEVQPEATNRESGDDEVFEEAVSQNVPRTRRGRATTLPTKYKSGNYVFNFRPSK